MTKSKCWEVWFQSNGHPTRRLRGGFYWMPGDIRTFATLGDIPDEIYDGEGKGFSDKKQVDRAFIIRQAKYNVPRNDKRLMTHVPRSSDEAEVMVRRMETLAAKLKDEGWTRPTDIPDDTELAVDVIALCSMETEQADSIVPDPNVGEGEGIEEPPPEV